MDDLVRWLTACLDEDAARATAAADGDSGEWFMGRKWNVYRAEDETPNEDGETNALVVYGNVKDQSEHIAEHDPARVLREIDSKRRILYLAVQLPKVTASTDMFDNNRDAWTEVLKQLAAPYSDRPGYLDSWRP